jgi:hypothetical protein
MCQSILDVFVTSVVLNSWTAAAKSNVNDSMPPQPPYSSSGVLKPDEVSEADISANEMASMMASMLGGLSGESSAAKGGASKSKGKGATKKTNNRENETAGRSGGASLSARLGSQARESKPEGKKTQSSGGPSDPDECFLSVGDKVLVMNKYVYIITCVITLHVLYCAIVRDIYLLLVFVLQAPWGGSICGKSALYQRNFCGSDCGQRCG